MYHSVLKSFIINLFFYLVEMKRSQFSLKETLEEVSQHDEEQDTELKRGTEVLTCLQVLFVFRPVTSMTLNSHVFILFSYVQIRSELLKQWGLCVCRTCIFN